MTHLIQERILTFVVHYGYLGLFGSMVFGMVGLPLPDEVLMTTAGYLVSEGKMQYILTVFISVLGSLLGMTISYVIGRKFGYSLLLKYGPKFHVKKHMLERSETWFKRFGKYAVTLGYFIPGLRHVTAYFAGVSKWSYRTFMIYAAPGGIIWVIIFVTLGTYMGKYYREVMVILHPYLLFVILAIIAVGSIWTIRNKIKRGV